MKLIFNECLLGEIFLDFPYPNTFFACKDSILDIQRLHLEIHYLTNGWHANLLTMSFYTLPENVMYPFRWDWKRCFEKSIIFISSFGISLLETHCLWSSNMFLLLIKKAIYLCQTWLGNLLQRLWHLLASSLVQAFIRCQESSQLKCNKFEIFLVTENDPWCNKNTVRAPNLSTTPYRTVPYRFPLQFLSHSRSLGARRTVFFA